MDRSILAIFEEAMRCTQCYGKVPLNVPLPDEKNGGIGAKILFVYERPGRRGTGTSGHISFDNKDPTAAFFKKLFSSIGIDRRDIFIANAVFCHPLIEDYKDRRPCKKEIRNCLGFLRRLIDIIQPKLIVTLGGTALTAVKLLFPNCKKLKHFNLKEEIGELISETQPVIYPLYHTSFRARVVRSEQQQMDDWQRIPDVLKRCES